MLLNRFDLTQWTIPRFWNPWVQLTNALEHVYCWLQQLGGLTYGLRCSVSWLSTNVLIPAETWNH